MYAPKTDKIEKEMESAKKGTFAAPANVLDEIPLKTDRIANEEKTFAVLANVLDEFHVAIATYNFQTIIHCFSSDGVFHLNSNTEPWKVHKMKEVDAADTFYNLVDKKLKSGSRKFFPKNLGLTIDDGVNDRFSIANFEEEFVDVKHGLQAKGSGSLCLNQIGDDDDEENKQWKISRYELVLLTPSNQKTGFNGEPVRRKTDAAQDQPDKKQKSDEQFPSNSSPGKMPFCTGDPPVPSKSNSSERSPQRDVDDIGNGKGEPQKDTSEVQNEIPRQRRIQFAQHSTSSGEEANSFSLGADEESITDSGQMEPGAYHVEGLAVGQLPAWARARSMLDRSLRSISSHLQRRVSDAANNEVPVSAVLVDDDELEANIRNQIISNAVRADVVESHPKQFNWRIILLFAISILIIVSVIGLSLGLVKRSSSGDDDSTEASIPTLKEVQERGFLRCGVSHRIGFGCFNSTTNETEGLTIDLCRAVAATILDDPNKVEFIIPSVQNRFIFLANRSTDIQAQGDTITLERKLNEATTGVGFSFSIPYLYDGLGFAGIPEFVECADAKFTFNRCDTLSICVQAATTHYDIISPFFPARHIFATDTLEAQFKSLSNGKCNVIAGEQASLGEKVARKMGYTGNYTIGNTLYSKEPLGVAVRDNDHQWASIVNGVIETLIFAEEQNLTQKALLAKDVNSSTIDVRFWKAVESVGNYGEIYNRHLESILPRRGLNELYGYNTNQSTGLMYSLPFGESHHYGKGLATNGILKEILSQGVLRCGVVVRVGFAQYDSLSQQWSGMDVDYCRGVTLSIFTEHDVDSKLVIVSLPPIEGELLTYLSNGTIDILSGGNFQLGQNMFENSSDDEGRSFTDFAFSTPYYYNDLFFGGFLEFQNCSGNLAMGDCPNVKICVDDETVHYMHLQNLVDPAFAVPLGYPATEGILKGLCNAIAGTYTDVAVDKQLPDSISEIYDKEYVRSPFHDSKYSLSLVVRGDDPQWSAFVDWIVMSTIFAEEEGITRFTANKMPLVNLFGESFERMLRDTVAFLGNYEEIYARNVERYVPRQGRNLLNGQPLHGPQHHSLLRERYTAE